MNLTDHLLAETWYWAGWILFVPILLHTAWKAPWRKLSGSLLNVWLGMIVALTLVWSLKAGVKPGLTLHLVGANIFTLCFGPRLAFIGLSAVIAAVTVNSDVGYFAYPLNVLLTAGTGVIFSHSFYYLVDRYLPNHFFIYIFITAFFGSALNIIVITLISSFFLILSDAYPFSYLAAEYQPYTLLLAFSEAWISGMVMTLFIVYWPSWVCTFDDARYLINK